MEVDRWPGQDDPRRRPRTTSADDPSHCTSCRVRPPARRPPRRSRAEAGSGRDVGPHGASSSWRPSRRGVAGARRRRARPADADARSGEPASRRECRRGAWWSSASAKTRSAAALSASRAMTGAARARARRLPGGVRRLAGPVSAGLRGRAVACLVRRLHGPATSAPPPPGGRPGAGRPPAAAASPRPGRALRAPERWSASPTAATARRSARPPAWPCTRPRGRAGRRGRASQHVVRAGRRLGPRGLVDDALAEGAGGHRLPELRRRSTPTEARGGCRSVIRWHPPPSCGRLSSRRRRSPDSSLPAAAASCCAWRACTARTGRDPRRPRAGPARSSAFAGPRALPVTGVGRGAAAALVAAAVTPAAIGAYDVADDEPLTRARLAEVLGAVVGRAVHRPSTWLARAALGSGMEFLLRSQRVSHLAFTEATGWLPQVRSAADGLPAARRGAHSCSRSSARARSAGYGLVNSTHRPSAGCSKPSSRACSHCRSSRSRFASTGSAP